MKTGGKLKIKEAHMLINIRLPRPIDIGDKSHEDSYQSIKSFLKQMELSIHHAQKSLEEMLKMEKESGNESPSFNIVYRPLNIEDSSTGEKFQGEHPCTDDIEIEIYTD